MPQDLAPATRPCLAALKALAVAARSRRGMHWIGAALLLALVVIISGERLERHLLAIESWLGALGPVGTLALIPLYVLLTSVLFPDTVLRVAAGALFGLGWGIAGVALGTLLGSLLQYGLAQAATIRIERLLAHRLTLRAMQRAVLREGLRLQLLIRLTPVNHAAVSYVLGAAGVRLAPFVLALPAVLPSIVLEVWIGHVGRHAARAASGTGNAASMSSMASYAGIAVGLVAIALVSRAAHRAVAQAMADDQVNVD